MRAVCAQSHEWWAAGHQGKRDSQDLEVVQRRCKPSFRPRAGGLPVAEPLVERHPAQACE